MEKKVRVAELGKKTILKGDLEFKDNLIIKGKYFGTIKSNATLYIDENAYFEGDISVNRSIIAGQIIGDITATEKIDILEKSVIKGNLKAPIIRIADGVKIEGRCQMIQDPDTIDIFTTSVNQLKKSVRIV